MEISNLLDAEFKTLVMRILSELRGGVDELSENFNKEMGDKNRIRKHENKPVRNEEHMN